MSERKLTEKQKRWIDYYIETGNATEAARLAGYKANTDKAMWAIGAENLGKLNDIVQERLNAKSDERIATQDEVLRYLTSVMRGEETEDCIVVESHGEGISRARNITKKVSPKDKLKAAEQLGKRYGLFTERVSVDSAVPIMVVGEDGLAD